VNTYNINGEMSMNEKVEKYPEGHFVGRWMCIGIAIISGIGIPLGIVTHNYIYAYIGPAIGVAFGMIIGQSIENKYKQEGRIRPLTEKEQKRKKNAVIAGTLIFTLGIFVCILFIFL
jgi:hypothetical protein